MKIEIKTDLSISSNARIYLLLEQILVLVLFPNIVNANFIIFQLKYINCALEILFSKITKISND